MKVGKLNQTAYLLRLEKGEEVITTLKSFLQEQKIDNAKFEGIGSIENPTLAHYRVDSKKYSEKRVEGIFEVTAFLGNVALFEQEPLIHAHITLGDEEMHTFSGHLVEGTVSATLEVVITTFPTNYEKTFDEEIGLKLWQLK
jgi:predicted DNA-binding protein with PD1-like motif